MEPLMISMLSQRDKLQEQLVKIIFILFFYFSNLFFKVRMQRRIDEAEERSKEMDRECESLRRQLHLQTRDMPLVSKNKNEIKFFGPKIITLNFSIKFVSNKKMLNFV